MIINLFKTKNMRKFEPNLILIVFSIIFGVKYSQAQIPVNDPAWVKDTALSDDFDGTAIKAYKWNVEDSFAGSNHWEMMFKKNITVSGGHARIKIDTLVPSKTYNGTTRYYQSGSLDSKDTSFKYGYLEISAKYPTGNEAYWPAFWGWNNHCGGSPWYNEIDICENGGTESLDGHIMLTNYFANISGCNNPMNNIAVPIANLPLLSSAFHKFGLEWAPDRMLYYFDDSLVRTVYDPTRAIIPQNHMYTIFDIYITNWLGNLPHMPADSLVIDYFYYYTLNKDCSTNKTICNPSTDYYSATPARAVERTIITGGASCSPTFNTSDACTLRATDSVTLDEGTTINPDGTGHFSIIIHPCPQ